MKEKTFFKILAISLSIILILMGLNINAYASITEATNKGTIKVSGIEAGLTVTAYQLTTVNYDYTEDQPQAVPYVWESNVKTWVHNNFPAYEDPENFYTTVEDDSDAAKAFYSKLAAAVKGGIVEIADANKKTQPTTGTAIYPVTAANTTSSVTFTDCAMGTYLILIENGYRVYSPSAVNLTPVFDRTNSEWKLATEVVVEVKSTTPTITKTVNGETTDNYSTKDTMNFKIVADVPTYLENSVANNYMISDKVNGGLVIDKANIKVSGQAGSATPVLLTSSTDYTLTTTDATRTNTAAEVKDVDFLVNFDYSKLKGLYNKVIVEYTATLAKDDTTKFGSTNKNGNTAFLDYSNNPYVANSYQEQKSSDNTIYTYGIEVSKVDKSDNTTPLSGAEFELSSGSDKLYFVKKADGVYYQTTSTDTDATKTTTLVVDASGKLNIKGLDVGTYSLKETKAPDGYNIATDPKTITIADTNMDGALEDNGATIASGIFSLKFPNGQGFQLPVTGGMGTTIFVACGIVVFGLGIMLLVVAVKKNKENK